jgi:DNA-binding CsgD family transcriptional regulator/sugar-specific transcriptional regulator TrmB
MLQALGLNATSELVYLTLLECPGVDFHYLTGYLDLSEREVRDALDELARMALVHTFGGWDRTPKVVDPEVGLAALVARKQAEVARKQREIEDGRLALATLLSKIDESHASTAEPATVRLDGAETIRRCLRDLTASTESEVCSFVPGGAQSAADLRASRALDADVIERGVRLRTIYLDSARNDGATLDHAHGLSDRGGEVRTVPTLPLRMVIVDRRVAVVPENLDDGDEAAVVVSHDGLVVALYTLFDSVWRTATPLGSRRSRDDEGLTEQGRAVLKLLGNGCTDELVARRLGVSVRTTRRVAAELFARLGAQSRFQAGARALARGWLDVDDLVS